MILSLLYTITYSVLMSISASLGLIIVGMKKNYNSFVSFLMLFIPKTVFSLVRFYFENYEANFPLLIILLLSMMLFDFMLIFVVFDCTFMQKILSAALLDMIFLPVLLVKQVFESKFLNDNNELVFENAFQMLLPLICYTGVFAALLVVIYFLGKLINKINFDKTIFNIFGKLALAGYFIIETISAVMFWENLVGRSNQFLQYFNCALIYCCTLFIMYIISNYFTKRRLLHEVEVLNSEKDRQYEYYNLMKNHNEEIRRIKHDLNGHFSVLDSLVKDKQYNRLEDYISSLSDKYKQIKHVVYTSNLTADAVICSVAEKCEQNGIKFKCDGSLPDKCFIDDISLTCIFSNILDNAFEACKRIDASESSISLSVYNKSNCIVINCKNSKSPDEKPKDRLFSTVKKEPGHGFGIRIIKEIVSNYNGVVNFDDKGKSFEVSLLIPDNTTDRKTELS